MQQTRNIALFIIFAVIISWYGVQKTIPANLIGGIYRGFVDVTNPNLHGLGGFEGVDIKGGFGTPLYAPFGGKITYVGLDGYSHDGVWPQSTMLVLKSGANELVLLHGNYIRTMGDVVQAGDLLGFEANNGWSTGSHSHIIFKYLGVAINPIKIGQKPLLITWYDPPRGGINAWGDGTVYRNGERVLVSHYGNTAACIPDWLNHQVIVGSSVWVCRDTGGAIVESWYYHIDLMLRSEPEYNLMYLFNYRVR